MSDTVIVPDDELRVLCEAILAEPLTDHEAWSERESDDMFRSSHYSGGFDATEMAFCFSRYADDGRESRFQLTLEEVRRVATGEDVSIHIRLAE